MTPQYTPAQMALINKHRDWNVDDSYWHAATIRDAKEILIGFGIDSPAISFSGFWSQGDGASFSTMVFSLADVMREGSKTLAAGTYGDPEKFEGVVKATYDFYLLVNTPLEALLLTSPEGREFCEGVQFRVHTRGSYSHSGTMSIEEDSDVDDSLEGWGAFIKVAPTDGDILTALRAIADAIYDALEAEHDYQTSDEQVWESLQANGVEVDEDFDEEALEHA